MSVVQLPSTRHYWREVMYIEEVASALTCNKFEEVKTFLHSFDKTKELKQTDPNLDRLQKIRPLLDILRKQLSKIPKEAYSPRQKHLHSMRQYNAKKTS